MIVADVTSGGAAAVVVGLTAASVAVALGGWILSVVMRRGSVGDQARPRPPWSGRVAGLVIAAAALVGLPAGRSVAVFLILVASNQILGRAENVPFSTYPMFSRPDRRSWSIRLEDGSGELVSTTAFGIMPPTLRKQFGTDLERARTATADLLDARRRAAAELAETIERRRPKIGPLADEAVSIVLVEYEFDGRVLHRARTVLATSAPP